MYSANGYQYRGDIAGYVMESAGWSKGFIGPQVAPVINVDDLSGEYPKFKLGTGNLLKRESNINRAPGAASARGTLAYEWDNYTTQERSFEIPVDRVDAKNIEKFFPAMTVAAERAMRVLQLEHEIRVAAMTFSTTNYGSATNSGTAYTIANIATFDVGLDVDVAKSRLLSKGESDENLTVVMSRDVLNRLRASTKLQNRLRGIGVASDTILSVDASAVAEALGVSQVLVGKNSYDSAAEGLDFSSSNIWSDTYLWVGRLGTSGAPASMLTGGAQYTLNWSQFGPPFGIFEYAEPQTKSVVVCAEQHLTEKVVNANAGTLIATQYS